MQMEFTGERVVPGQVDVDLWNEHFARYAFAAHFCNGKKVLDAGCGTGYGAAELARVASSVVALDVSQDALIYGRSESQVPVGWVAGSATHIPFADASFDVVVAFEVIEHLAEWRGLLNEARRILAPDGRLIVSTPNQGFYSESRAEAGPNPFHHHEFVYEEFYSALREYFPVADTFLQDHSEGILFRAVHDGATARVRIDGRAGEPGESNFFIAVCAAKSSGTPETFVYLPSSTNLLRERAQHIRRLGAELQLKNTWLEEAQDKHRTLLSLFEQQADELKKRTEWAQQLNSRLNDANQRIVELQNELTEIQEAATRAIGAMQQELEATEQRLTAELGKCVELLHSAESIMEERTNWALQEQGLRNDLEARMRLAADSRWMRLGRLVGLGPELRNS